MITSLLAFSSLISQGFGFWAAWRRFWQQPVSPGLMLALVLLGLLLEMPVLWQATHTQTGWDFSFYNAMAIVAWLALALALWLCWQRQSSIWLLLVLPWSALALLLQHFLAETAVSHSQSNTLMWAHVLPAVLAYSLFFVAALQAGVLLLAERWLHRQKPFIWRFSLPPLESQEQWLFRFLKVAVLLLSLSLVGGFLLLENLFAQHLVHKTVLSLLSWLLFVLLLWGRRQWGWRGRKAAWMTLAGFALLLLGFAGSQLVLDVILRRT